MDPFFSKVTKASFNLLNPHGLLGIFEGHLIYQWSPNKKEHSIIVKGEVKEMTLINESGLFVYDHGEEIKPSDYQVIHSDGTVGFDPYSCTPSFSMVDVYLFDKGEHFELYKVLGSHYCTHDGMQGCKFAVYAPNALYVHLRCDMGNWRETIYPMRKVAQIGIFELFIPGARLPMMYKYSITTKDHQTLLKSDPFGRRFELRPKTATIAFKAKEFSWTDKQWMKAREESFLSAPMNIYELHLGSWSRGDHFPNFKEIASELVAYMKEMGYTHVELMPITEYPLDESWGYQVIGYFAPTARYGTAEDFKYFVNHLHMHGIGVVFDFVAAHFPKDADFLAKFDGSFLFEHPHPLMENHPQWDTLTFNYESPQVVNFLIASALFWVKQMHVDMIRVDAVQSILYLDYYRKEGEFERNHLGGIENLAGIDFLEKLNESVHKYCPGVLLIAEDPSLHQGVTKPIELFGLGFSMKWNIGWINDLFQFLTYSEEEKKQHWKLLLNSYSEVFRERYLLTISHDEVSHEKKSLLKKFSTEEREQFAYLRLLYSVTIAHPGKKLFFMGHEVGDPNAFNEKLSFRKVHKLTHAQIKHKCFTREMNHLYLNEKALHEIDFDEKGFAWVDYSDPHHSLISFVRKGAKETLLCVHNFSNKNIYHKLIPLPGVKSIEELMNTDDKRYGGDHLINSSIEIHPEGAGLFLQVPKLSSIFCKVIL